MSKHGPYVISKVDDDGKEVQEIQEAGFIGTDNIRSMKFTFAAGKDITESINKRPREQVSATKNGRIGYTPMTCTYPNGTDSSSKVILKDCIIQYREGVTKEDSNYAISYVCIGIPSIYISKVIDDGRRNSSLTIGVNDKTQHKNDYYWFNANLDNLSEQNTWIIHKDADGDDAAKQVILREVLAAMGASITCTICATVSGSMTTDIMAEALNLKGGTYSLTIKPTEVFLQDVTNIEGPVLDDTQKRLNTTTQKSLAFTASEKLAAFAMRNLTIS